TTSVLAWTLNKAIDPTSVGSSSVLVRNNNTGAQIAGSFTVNGGVITFTPAGPLPGNTSISTQINLNNAVLDLAGNQANTFGGSFTTGP
ncbi:MAG TPA: Ig-like domain-containing protein, partial [Candidatus Angelobacter sp.]|nr:Ig-like domain-containing protein [Candidatus Angelobacter sp.]